MPPLIREVILHESTAKYQCVIEFAHKKTPYPVGVQLFGAIHREPWLIFSNTDEFNAKNHEAVQPEGERFLVLSLLVTQASIVLWYLDIIIENKGIHLKYQANSLKSRRVLAFLTLAENVLKFNDEHSLKRYCFG